MTRTLQLTLAPILAPVICHDVMDMALLSLTITCITLKQCHYVII